jgi:hypothetical protein
MALPAPIKTIFSCMLRAPFQKQGIVRLQAISVPQWVLEFNQKTLVRRPAFFRPGGW